MSRAVAFPALLALLGILARAQTDADPHGPVVMPPSATETNTAPGTGPVVMPPSHATQPDATLPSPAAPPTSAPFSGSLSTPSGAPAIPSATPGTGQADELDDIRPPFFYLHSWAWLWLTLLALALAALLIGLWLWFKPLRVFRAKSAYELALEKLQQARALLDEENPEPYAVAVSETVRSYLGHRFSAPSTRRTTEEFLRQMESDPATPLAEHRDLLREFLEACDLVKFAHYQPGRAELEQVHARAVTFVTATQPVEPKQKNSAPPAATARGPVTATAALPTGSGS